MRTPYWVQSVRISRAISLAHNSFASCCQAACKDSQFKVMGFARPPHQRALQAVVCFAISYLVSIAVVKGIGGDEAFTDGASYYTEDLTLQQLGQRHVAARFVFRSTWTPKNKHRCQEHEDWPRDETIKMQASSYSVGKLCHFEAVFPRAMGVLLDRFEVHQLSLQMSKGKWDIVAWGNGPDNGGEYTPGGAEMWARLPLEGAWENWVGLRRSLSGLYCVSLDGMDESRVHTPAVMTLPGQTAPSSNATTVLRGTLPREPVCTENLIPLIKMLPCRSKTGLGGILHPTRLFQSDYHSVSVRATATFSDGDDGNKKGTITSLTLEQKVLAVFRPRPFLPSAVPKSRQEIAREGKDGWSILTLLSPPKSVDDAPKSDRSVMLRGCSVASRSAIHVHGVVDNLYRSRANCRAEECDAFLEASSIVDNKLSSGVIVTRRLGSSAAHQVRLDNEDGVLESISHFMQKKLWAFDSETGGVFPVNRVDGTTTDEVRASEGVVPASPERPVADARLENFFSGRGGSRGVFVSHLVNMHPEEDAYAEFLQPVPYFMVPLVGSMQARVVATCPSVQPPLGNDSTTPDNGDAASMMPWDDGFSRQSCGEGGERNGHATFETPGPVLGLAQNLSFTPGNGHSPAIIEARLWVPAASTLVLGFDFLKRFLTVDDFPPDPSRGFDVPPPLARFHFPHAGVASCPAHGNDERKNEVGTTTCAVAEGAGLPGRIVYAHGDAGLLDTPQPDYSMPFNVITFTSTIITFFLGTAINLLVRKNAHHPKKKKAAAAKQGDKPGGFGRVREALRKALAVQKRWRRRGQEVISSPQGSNG